MYTLLLAVIYLVFISLGLPDSLLGSGWPTMRLVFDQPLSAAGAVSMIITGGTICSSLLSERLTARFTTKGVTVASVFLSAAALFGFSVSTRFWMLCLWAVPYGLAAGCIDSAINNYVALHYRSRHMSWLHCFWGVGTVISPCVMSWALTRSGWQLGYRTVALMQLAIGAVLVLTLPLWRAHGGGEEQSARAGQVLGIRGALKIKGAPTLFVGFFAYCGAEGTSILWASSYLAGERGFSAEHAAASAAVLYVGITLGRFISGFIADKVGDRGMIRLGTGVVAAALVVLALPGGGELGALLGLGLLGLGNAPVYPAIIHATPANFGAENSQGIIGMQMASAYVGSTLMPPLFGLIANRAGLFWMPFFLAVLILLMIVMLETTFRTVEKNR
ncbi:MAG TPA: MFS transporter [Candidatus Fournierella merdipullorum]|uniref:MFS transporter n=1 Tax=Candidatus Allofournierella merdipullorum TaxID=2838595 RepID=A0A9D2E2D7_9FIRM|nr:MFS transporter [Candidatus Fournierella merdipullorum]